MSFDMTLDQRSRMGLRCFYVLIAFCLLLTLTATIAILIKILLIAMFTALSLAFVIKKPASVKLTFDGSSWYIHTPEETFTAARIDSVRDFIWCRVFKFIDEDGDRYQQTIWQDQVHAETWRRLSVFNTLYAYK